MERMLCFESVLMWKTTRRSIWWCPFLIFEHFFNDSWILLIYFTFYLSSWVGCSRSTFSVGFKYRCHYVDFEWDSYQWLTPNLKTMAFSSVKIIGMWTKFANINWSKTSIFTHLKKGVLPFANCRKPLTLHDKLWNQSLNLWHTLFQRTICKGMSPHNS